tara:strand:+ start:1105 stop:2481 length:1377 start_codon:yes stop_codon:yes gene_type:complete
MSTFLALCFVILALNVIISINNTFKEKAEIFFKSGKNYKIFNYNIIYLTRSFFPVLKITEKLDSAERRNKEISVRNNELALAKDLVNELIFPSTQFLNLDFLEVQLKNKTKIKKNKIYKLNNVRDSEDVSPFYIESYNNKVIITTINGNISYFNYKDLINKKSNRITLKNNLPEGITVGDTLIHNNKIYLSFRKNNESCRSHSIFAAKIDIDFLKFDEVYSQTVEKKFECNQNLTGGRMAFLKKNDNNFLFLTVIRKEKISEQVLNQWGQDIEYKHADIIEINLNNKNSEIYSTGHRNPQGLLVTKDNFIISTEHGPRGGDEINLIKKGKNYGWPKASYGENYGDKVKNNAKYKFLKNHFNYSFEEPIYSFVPSIGISQIFELPDNFSPRWKGSYLVTSLRAGSIYRVNFKDGYSRIVTMERIRIKKRIRDIAYNTNNNSILLALENNSGTIGIISVR